MNLASHYQSRQMMASPSNIVRLHVLGEDGKLPQDLKDKYGYLDDLNTSRYEDAVDNMTSSQIQEVIAVQNENSSQQPHMDSIMPIEEVRDRQFQDNSKFVRSLMQHEFEAKRGSVKVVQVDLQPRKVFESRPIGDPMAIDTESEGNLKLELARLNSTRPSNRYSQR